MVSSSNKNMDSRHDALVRAAEMRAKVIGIINSCSVSPNSGTVCQLLGIDPKNKKALTAARNLLDNMVKQGLLMKLRGEGGIRFRVTSTATTPRNLKVNHTPIPTASPPPGAPDITVDLIKATGRVRILIGGMVIEVGVIG